MPIYTTKENLKAELPSGEPDGYNETQWNTKLNEIIAQKSQQVDDSVGGNYAFSYGDSDQKFPDITDDPCTPATIEKCCRYLACSDALGYFSGIYNADDNALRLRRRDWAEKKLEKIRQGIVKISVAGVTLYQLSFATINNRNPEDEVEPIFNKDAMDDRWS